MTAIADETIIKLNQSTYDEAIHYMTYTRGDARLPSMFDRLRFEDELIGKIMCDHQWVAGYSSPSMSEFTCSSCKQVFYL